MKTTSLVFLMTSFIVFSCISGEKTDVQKASFGIFETVRVSEIPGSVIDSLKKANILLADDPQVTEIGYVLRGDSISLQSDLSKENIRLLKACYPVDKEGQYQALVVVRREPVINNSDIQKTRNTGQNIEIYFTMEGARKWADMTKNNIGKSVAFVIDDLVYSMPLVNGEIKGGVAMISGLENETTAKKLSDYLNSGL
jgi:preprotein translocase subunit SecD